MGDGVHVCAREGCAEPVPRKRGERPANWRRRLYHSDECRTAGQLTERPCACGCGQVFHPRKSSHLYVSRSCAARARQAARTQAREEKRCECGCGENYARPVGLGGPEWERRKYKDAEHRARAGGRAGAARAGRRTAPRPVPSRDRRPAQGAASVPAVEPVRFGQVPAVRERVSTIERASRPRPSFGLSRRAG